MPDSGVATELAAPAGGTDAPAAAKRRNFIEQARRAQIVQAAIETIAEVGYTKATFARIAERADISPGLISYHFSSREKLIAQVIAHIESAMEQAIEAETENAQSYASALRGIIETQVRYFGDHVTEVLALGQIFDASHRDAGLGAIAAASRDKTLAELEGMFREGQAEGELGGFAPRPMAVTVLAALEAVPAELFANPDTDVDAYARSLADLFDLATRKPARRLRR